MRFLLDESVPEAVSVALRAEGHDGVRAQETILRGADDETVWAHAVEDERVFLTGDLDFPLYPSKPAGLILVRYPDRVSVGLLTILVLDAVRSLGDDLLGRIVVVAPGRLRTRDL